MKKRVFLFGVAALALAACNSGSSDPVSPGASSSSDLYSSAVVGSSASGTPYEPVPTGQVGTRPTGANIAQAQSLYSSWKNVYYQSFATWRAANPTEDELFIREGTAAAGRIIYQTPSATVSEGIGYGMLISFFQNDMETFRALWAYHKAFRESGTNLMAWQASGFSSVGLKSGSATDADLDVATALLLAYRRDGGVDYLTDALAIASSIWDTEIATADGSYLIYSGNKDFWKTNFVINPSYFSPVAFRLFATYDTNPAHAWGAVLDKNYEFMVNINANGSGLFPDWVNSAGTPTNPGQSDNGVYYDQYSLESIRIPWRLAWDYMWYGEQRAGTILNRMASFITTATAGNFEQVNSRYAYVGGAPSGTMANQGTRSSLCAVGLVSNGYQTWLDACTQSVTNFAVMVNMDDSYFDDIVTMLYLQLLHGMVVRP